MKKILTTVVITCSFLLLLTLNYEALDFPTAKIDNLHVDEDSIAVTYDLIDTSNDILMNTSEYYSNITLNKDNQVIKEIKITEGINQTVQFTGLDSNTEYTININAPYDLLASNEPYNEAPYTILTEDCYTYKRQPTGEILPTSKSSFNSIFIDTKITDFDSALIDAPKLELVKNDQVINTIYLDDTSYTFNDLDFNSNYSVNLIALYDIDGNSVSDGELLLSTKDFTTGDYYTAPTVNFNPPTITGDSLLVSYDLIDADNTLLANKSRIVLKQGEEDVAVEIPTVGINQTQLFEDLDKGDYTVEITGQYDIDGDGISDNDSPYILGSKDYTLGGVVTPPTGSLALTPFADSISTQYTINDGVEPAKLELYRDDELLEDVLSPSNPYMFDNLAVDTSYSVVLSSGNTILDIKNVTTLIDEAHTVLVCKDLESIGRGSYYKGATHLDAWDLNDDYVLGKDIDCSASSDPLLYGIDGFDPIGEWTDVDENGFESSSEIDSLSGSLDGSGYKVSGLYINHPDRNFIGLVKLLEKDAVITNIGLENSYVSGGLYLGGLAGFNQYGNITNSYYIGDVTGKDFVGGFVGANYYGDISSSYSAGTVSGNGRVGGLVGNNASSTISNSYSTSNVTANNYAGGIVGLNSYGDIFNCYSTGNITGNSRVGGLLGGFFGGNISNSYSTSNTNGGSLVGEMGDGATINNSFASGNSRDGLVGKKSTNDSIPIVSNSYQYANATCTVTCNNYPVVTTEQLNDKAWYVNTLKFNNNFKLSDVDSGYYPHVMKTDLSEELGNQEYIVLP